jgi:hypothetical protein
VSTAPCPVCGFDGRRVSPSDAAVALRSYPRRFREVLKAIEEDDRPDDVLHRRPRSGGVSAMEHAAWVAAAVAAATEALRLVLIQDAPAITLPAVEPERGVTGADGSVDEVVARIDAATSALASLIERTPASDWTRTGRVEPEGAPVRALDIVALAVHIGSLHLRATDATINAVARELPEG